MSSTSPSSTQPGPDVSLDRVGAAAVVTLRRPDKLNAFTHSMLAQIEQAVRTAVADRGVVGVIITGEGRGFSAGLDSSALTATTSAGSSSRPPVPHDELAGLFSYLLVQPKPIIAAINGVAAGGGFVLATKCDLRFASTDASFVTIFSKRGLIAEHGTTWLLPRLVGTGDALDLLWSSRRIDATEALRIGLVQRVFEPDQLLTEAIAYVDLLAETVSPGSLSDTKRLVYSQLGSPMAEAFLQSDEATWQAIDRPDAAEGAAALVERRPPQFERLGETAT